MPLRQMIKEIYIIFFVSFFFSSSFADETFLSLKNDRVNVRYGPSLDFPVKYVYKKINLPVKQIDEKENWRRIIDLKNNSGWIHRSQLKSINSIIPLKDKILFKKPSSFSKPLVKVESGRLLIVKKCIKNWCKIKTGNYSGWVRVKNIWGSPN